MFHGSLRQNGSFVRAEGYPARLYTKKKAVIRAAYRENKCAPSKWAGDILLICCDPFSDVASANMEHYGGIVAKHLRAAAN